MGAIVTGIDLGALEDHAWHAIEQAFHDHGVLIFPGQHLSAEEQYAFAGRFGDIEHLAP